MLIIKNTLKALYIIKKKILYVYTSLFHKKLKIMDSKSTIKYIIDNKCSVARCGNGEMDILLGDSKHFQNYNAQLASELKEIKTSKNILVCVPELLENKKKLNEQNNNFWKKHRYLYLYYWRKYYSNNIILGDACFTRFYMDSKNKDADQINKYLTLLSNIWNGREVIIVEGQFTRFGIGNNLLQNAKSIKRIICPSENAYTVINRIEDYIIKHISKNSLILISLGPTATVLAYRLSQHYFQAVDIGHLDIEYEWYIRGLQTKEAVQNKYTNEVDNGRIVHDDFDSQEYREQIIAEIL